MSGDGKPDSDRVQAAVDEMFDKLREQHWFGSADPEEFAKRAGETGPSRALAQRIWLIPVVVFLCAAATYGTHRWMRSIPVDLEIEIDGQPVDAGAHSITIEDGHVHPLTIRVPGKAPVQIQIDLPDGLDPRLLEGARYEIQLSTDPNPEQSK